ncbi:hypothetical protein R52603_01063 [Paraburkholderia saeva]|uniref:Uncharacterized protein n=1 Tax=Paraburkholderia saeva TaxID=2777537 RepID=A0A9N8RXB3_9BURK|nr:hypothetical protein R52603_01063 [Paraburkholderia saeva]CAG4896483.1 hypothetical protein R70241_02208 [Paraburkholderia saeva]CAG4901871.1 hypothetical protein LMG31841_03041 [Paraburkholderia saeva]
MHRYEAREYSALQHPFADRDLFGRSAGMRALWHNPDLPLFAGGPTHIRIFHPVPPASREALDTSP